VHTSQLSLHTHAHITHTYVYIAILVSYSHDYLLSIGFRIFISIYNAQARGTSEFRASGTTRGASQGRDQSPVPLDRAPARRLAVSRRLVLAWKV